MADPIDEMVNPYMTPALLRAARAVLGWTRGDLAERCRVSAVAIGDYEKGARVPHRVTYDAIAKAIEDAGVEFIGEGSPSGLIVKKPELHHASPRDQKAASGK